ncbi:MAG: caspase family protein [Chthoniobacterales bacterium]
MNFPRALAILLCLLPAIVVWGAPVSSPRTALVIGNERYESLIGPLRNTANDAKAMARTLRGLGFTVIERHNLTRDQFLKAVAEFRGTLKGAEVGIFYYAGHGISIDGSNYLIPIKSGFAPGDADDATLRMLAETHLFNAEQAVADMVSADAKCNIVILDACRTTRLPGGGRSRGIDSRGGLSEMAPPAGSLIAFATDAGRTAYDGDGANGLYTEELLKNLATPGLTIEQVFKRTRAGVLKRSDGAQMPAEYSRLVGDDVYLAGEMRAVAAEPVATAPPAPAAKTEGELMADATKFAATGQAKECLDALEAISALKGQGNYAAAPIETLLERVKEDLKVATVPSSRVVSDLAICELLVRSVPQRLPKNHARASEFLAKAQNRRGDCLMLLERPKEALDAYNAAASLAPDDAYILYNRGRANLALGNAKDARKDFSAAVDPRFKQPGARKLAADALVKLGSD